MKYQYVGMDVGKEQLDVAMEHESYVFDNSPSGFKALQNTLKKGHRQSSAPVLVIAEASGGYEKNVLAYLRDTGYTTHRAHPNKVRAFARSKGYLAKTDKLDAKVLVEYGACFSLEAQPYLLCETTEKIGELLKRRQQLLDDKISENHRLDKTTDPDTVHSIERHRDWLVEELKRLDNSLEEERKGNEAVNSHFELLTSVPSIGPLTALYCIAFLPELGEYEHGALSALVGVAPFNRDSGKSVGKRFIQGGRKIVRDKLYMAAISAIRCHPTLKPFYHKLREKGKPAKVAIIAVLRKLLTMLNSVARRQSPWQECYKEA